MVSYFVRLLYPQHHHLHPHRHYRHYHLGRRPPVVRAADTYKQKRPHRRTKQKYSQNNDPSRFTGPPNYIHRSLSIMAWQKEEKHLMIDDSF